MSFAGVHGSPSLRTYVSNTASILPSGFVTDLGIEQIGFFNVDQTGRGVPEKAVSNPTFQTAPFFKLGIGRPKYAAQDAIQPKVTKFPLLTQEIFGGNILRFEGTKANNEPSTEIYTVGYDGVDARKRLYGSKDYRELIFQIRLWGNPIRQLTGVRKDLIRQYYISKGCIDRCVDVCETNPGLADEYIADELIKQIKDDKFNVIPITRFLKVTKLRKSADADTPITGVVTSNEYSLVLCDDGSNTSLGLIQTQYPGFKVERTARLGSTSTYVMWRTTAQSTPATFTNTAPIALAVCNECPSGYTLVEDQTVYTIQRPIAPTTDVSTTAAQQTYANTIGSAYGTAARGVTGVTLSAGGTGYTNGTFPLQITGGGGTGAAGTITVVGGVAQQPVITDKGINYTSAPTVAASGVTGGTGLGTFTATINAAPTTTSKFVTSNGGIATVTVSVDADTAPIAALLADTITNVSTASAYCTPPAGDTIAWAATGNTRSVAPKQFMITLGDTICGDSRLAELQAAYPELVIAEEGSAGNCARVYTTSIYSDPLYPETCSIVEYEYNTPDGYTRNQVWEEYVAPLVNPDCTTPETEDVCVAAGVKFETAGFTHEVSDCLYGYYSYDIANVDPVYMEISVHTHDWTAAPCYITDQVVTKLRGTQFTTGDGAYIREHERSTLQYEGFVWTTNPAFNEAWGIGQFSAKQGTWYDTYKLTVGFNNNQHSIIGKVGTTTQISYVFAFPTGMGKSFETLINGYIASLNKPELRPVVL
jgi:hypothetical protein